MFLERIKLEIIIYGFRFTVSAAFNRSQLSRVLNIHAMILLKTKLHFIVGTVFLLQTCRGKRKKKSCWNCSFYYPWWCLFVCLFLFSFLIINHLKYLSQFWPNQLCFIIMFSSIFFWHQHVGFIYTINSVLFDSSMKYVLSYFSLKKCIAFSFLFPNFEREIFLLQDNKSANTVTNGNSHNFIFKEAMRTSRGCRKLERTRLS